MAERTVAALIITNLTLGILFAVGHHLFYASLDGRIVETLSQQEWNLRIGTGLSFLVRAFLSASIGSAYIQLLWHNLKSTKTSIKGVDALLGVLHNIRDLALWELWSTRPILTAVALLIWALPLIVIVTPATLTVGPSSELRENNVAISIPVPEYADPLRYAQYGFAGGVYYAGPSSRISRLVSSVSSAGIVSSIPPLFPNSSYTLEFYGPVMKCENLDPLTSELAQSVNQVTSDYYRRSGGNGVGYIGFVPTHCLSDNSYDCNGNDTDVAIGSLQRILNSTASTDDSLDSVSDDYAKFYVVVPNSTLAYNHFRTIRCGLYNSSYSGTITFDNGQQVLDFSINRMEGLPSNLAISACATSQKTCNTAAAYLSIFDALGKVLVGMITVSHYGYAIPERTHILSSVLMQTQEVQTLSAFNRETDPRAIANISMAEALEQVFTNTTLSLLSDSYFLQNETMAAKKTVIVRSPQNMYRYTSRNLLIAYSLGCGVTFLIVIVGLLCMYSASASFSITFSTILRTTQHLHSDPGILSAETSGANPLPKRLAKTRLVFRRQSSIADDDASQTWSFSVADGQSAETIKLRETASVDENR